MIFCKELNKNFTDKRVMFKAIKTAKQEIIAAKKATIKLSDPVFTLIPIAKHDEPFSLPTTKAFGVPKEVAYGDFVYPIINTINYLDSHKDVHLWGIWDKSAKEQNGKVYYIINHELELGKVISYPNNVEIMIKEMTWKDLGSNYEGKTQALVFKAKLTERSNKDAYDAIKAGDEIQNSVRMQYVRLELAINSKEDYYKDELAAWTKYSPLVVNKEALEDGYFWAVHEAKIYMEGSAVLFGSNCITPVQYEEPKHKIEPLTSTQRAVTDTRTKEALNNLSNYFKS